MYLLIILLIASVSYSAPIPELTPLNYSALPAHKIYGYITSDGSPFDVLGLTGDAWVIIDPINHRYATWYTLTFPTDPPFTTSEFTWILDNTTYTYGSFFHSSCLESHGWNWTTFVNEGRNTYALPDSNSAWASYHGYIRNYATCGRASAQLINLKRNEFNQMALSTNLLIPSPPICYNTKNIYEFEPQSIEYDGFDADFVLPSSCYPANYPPEYCDYVPTC